MVVLRKLIKELPNPFKGEIRVLDIVGDIERCDSSGFRWVQVHNAKCSRSDDAADRIHCIVVSDFAESPDEVISNIWLSIIQLAEFVEEENDILRPSICPE